MKKILLLTTFLIAFFLVTEPVSAAGPTFPRFGIVHGVVTSGPVSPLCQQDVPCFAPVRATFIIKQNNNPVRTVSTNKKGFFHTILSSGSYTIEQAGCPKTLVSLGCLGQTQMTVKAGLNRFEFNIDTGLR